MACGFGRIFAQGRYIYYDENDKIIPADRFVRLYHDS
jgi:hypothetical protein